MLQRRALLAAPALLTAPARAQGRWPDRPVRALVGFPPGGSLDVMTRLMAEQMSQRLGPQFVVENRTGAAGQLAAEALARATPDGYTLGTVGMPTALISPMLYRKLPYDPGRDFAWIAEVWEFPNVVVVPASLPVRTLAEFLAWARQQPGGISYGSSGVGTTIHLCGAWLLARAGIQGTHIVFRGAAQTIPAMLAGDVQLAVDNLASYVPVIKEGRLRALAVTSETRWPTLPAVPTMAEAGMDRFVVTSWHMWAGPLGFPDAAQQPLLAAIQATCADPAVQARALEMGARLIGRGPAAVRARLDRERPFWAEMVKVSGAQVE
jgi:tripartite-type tricarboxylate transporter receptor subunit TctC